MHESCLARIRLIGLRLHSCVDPALVLGLDLIGEKGMLKTLLGCWSRLWVPLNHALDEIDGLG